MVVKSRSVPFKSLGLPIKAMCLTKLKSFIPRLEHAAKVSHVEDVVETLDWISALPVFSKE